MSRLRRRAVQRGVGSMNIFVLSESPLLAAQYQHDRHVVKMTLESAQLLSTAIWQNERLNSIYQAVRMAGPTEWEGPESGTFDLYKSTHPNHPCAVWTRQSDANFCWLTLHFQALLEEYAMRFRKTHGCHKLLYIF